jgi:hypothetical protein
MSLFIFLSDFPARAATAPHSEKYDHWIEFQSPADNQSNLSHAQRASRGADCRDVRPLS